MGALLDSRQWKKMNDAHYSAAGTDAWLLKGSGGGLTGAIRIMNPKPEVVALWTNDVKNCITCQRGDVVPHGTTSIFSDGSLYTYQCRSGSRSINPVTGELVGHSHCTCDGCW